MKILNNSFIAIFSLSISLFMIGCSEYEQYDSSYEPSLEDHTFRVEPLDFSFGNGIETNTGNIVAQYSWSFTDIPSWLSISPSSGETDAEFFLTSTPNETLNKRAAVFNISTSSPLGWTQQKRLTASQSAAYPILTFPDLESTTLYLTGVKQTITIKVNTNIDDLVTEVVNAESWLSASYQNKQLTITVNDNTENKERQGTVQLSSSTSYESASIIIKQSKPNISFNEISSLYFNADGGKQTMNITSELPWIASSNAWIEISPSQANAGTTQLTVDVTPSYQSNNRNGNIYFYYKEKSTSVGTIYITQTGRYINTSSRTVTLSAEENSSNEITVKSNIGWGVATCPEWISVSPKLGDEGETKMTITAQKNNSLNSRSGTIKIKDSVTGGISTSLSVKQDGINFGDGTVLEFGWQTSTQELYIPLPTKWNAAVSAGWITMSQYTGTEATTCSITVTRNDSPDVRRGEITFTSEGKEMKVAIVQEGQYITIDSESGEFSAMGGVAELYVSTTMDIVPTVEYDETTSDWVVYEKASDKLYKITIKYNPSITQRNATFILKPSDSDVKEDLTGGVHFKIKQFGRDLRVEPSKIYLFSKGGTTDLYSIYSDGKYTISKGENDAWFTIVHNDDTRTFYLVISENNTGVKRHGEVIVKLDELPTGESKQVILPVIQAASGDIDIIIDDFNEPELW